MRRKTFSPLPEGINIGDVISYYANGWRTGRLDKVKGNEVGIYPTGTYLHAAERLKWVLISDIKKVE
jgi:hypothetical protein